MKLDPNFDFSGYATKNDLKCTDGRTIIKDAFKHQDGTRVPLVWQHIHNDPENVLGHAILENREDGVYAYGYFNDTPAGKQAKALVQHKDVDSMSIYANELLEKAKSVLHGTIREISLVLSRANPGALIDNIAIAHGDGNSVELEDEVIIQHNQIVEVHLEHASDNEENSSGKTVAEVFESMTDEQKEVVYALIGQAVEEKSSGTEEVEHSNLGDNVMKKNVFDGQTGSDKKDQKTLTHADFLNIVEDAKKRGGSFREAFLAHATTYGIENIDYLFPDAQNMTQQPVFIKRDTEWVSQVLGATHKTPFSRIKTIFADITEDTARALGYPVKGALKKEEFFKLMKRVTTPTTVYKKQKLDRDDIVDIVDFDVVVWMKAEMRLMLEEELARAELVGDGRAVDSGDKISEDNIRPIWKDDDLYSHKVQFAADDTVAEMEETIIRAQEYYKGSGSPTLYTTQKFLNDLLLQKDEMGRRIYKTKAEVADALGVSSIVLVPVMANLTRTTGTAGVDLKTWALKGIIVNLHDYSLGADKGGQTSFFDDFDLDYNQFKYLLETRCSGALTLPKAALILEQDVTAAG